MASRAKPDGAHVISSAAQQSAQDTCEREVRAGDRFQFGVNWSRFLRLVDEARIRAAEQSLVTMLRGVPLDGASLLDIGCGSGLFSLAACRRGARVHSFDFDPHSVACARELRRRYAPDRDAWTIEQGSVLDAEYMRALGTFDVVYSWGVLHHTGRLWGAVDAAAAAVAPGGTLCIAIYNDLGSRTRRWRAVKRAYNRLPTRLQPVFAALVSLPEECKTFVRMCLTGRPDRYIRRWTTPDQRGMSHWRDIIDWVGGYPYEAATPEQVFDFCRARGFTLTGLRCGGVGLGCNEFTFARAQAAGRTHVENGAAVEQWNTQT
jgi:2-polyprenyl-3-methyl-5-hydroxy-6-metoxy-1,4-benzoquinol methylase